MVLNKDVIIKIAKKYDFQFLEGPETDEYTYFFLPSHIIGQVGKNTPLCTSLFYFKDQSAEIITPYGIQLFCGSELHDDSHSYKINYYGICHITKYEEFDRKLKFFSIIVNALKKTIKELNILYKKESLNEDFV